MNFKTTGLALAVTFALFANFSNEAQSQEYWQIPFYVYYVERDSMHLGSGASWTSTFGPYNTREQAEVVADWLDMSSNSSTVFSTPARIYRAVNPALFARPNSYGR